MDKADKILAIAVILVIAYWIAALVYPEMVSPFNSMYEGLTTFAIQVGYPGALIGSLIGNATIVFPFPYVIIPFVLGGILDPTLVGIVSAVGALAGEMSGYVVGYGGGQLLDESRTEGFRKYAENHPRAIPLLIWFLALTPLPDDFLIVPLGAAKYPWWKIVIPSFIGKAMMLIGIAWAGFFGMEFVAQVFGGGGPDNLVSRSIETLTVLLIIIAVYLLVKIDWTKLMPKTN